MTETVSAEGAARRRYDAIIVGGGWAGSVLAKRLGAQGWQVLVLEAGNGGTETWPGYLDSLSTFYSAVAKVPNAAYRPNKAAPSPNVLDLAPVPNPQPGEPEFTAHGYFVQNGQLPYGTDYLRELGGAAMHWLGAVPRMLPDDFATRSTYSYGLDWPLTAEDLQPWYAEAEAELGVAGHAQEQKELGVVTDPAYEYPMHHIPQSYIDQYCDHRLGDAVIDDTVAQLPYTLRTFGLPQARNSTPNPAYRPRTASRAPSACPTTASAVWATPAASPSVPSRPNPIRCASRPPGRPPSPWPPGAWSAASGPPRPAP
ncbi:NAD(P)-binding protein [Streptomyces endophytica]|uniref:Uncharacterized protein n=1 Tax=Streptomyces endophytica TaxID=2991496 RepID=A0ABY6PEV6_9ACTN|nr:NAD(P)-binding protein [Streptomyces endophytica]UZJ31717.1 hypothetical protein OJ254_17285 [Streptomyces endophytica]